MRTGKEKPHRIRRMKSDDYVKRPRASGTPTYPSRRLIKPFWRLLRGYRYRPALYQQDFNTIELCIYGIYIYICIYIYIYIYIYSIGDESHILTVCEAILIVHLL